MNTNLQTKKAALPDDLHETKHLITNKNYNQKTAESQDDKGVSRLHIEAIQACCSGCEGNFVIASFGQNPHTGEDLPSVVSNFPPDQITQIEEFIVKNSKQKDRNVYMPLCLMRPDLPKGKKGGEKDIVAVFGLVADFDDERAHDWKSRIPCSPSYVLETSPGRFQVGFLFDKPLSPSEAKPLAVALKKYCNCDHGTADISHVWRIPGTLNWPNKTKLDAGRSPEPWEVRHVEL